MKPVKLYTRKFGTKTKSQLSNPKAAVPPYSTLLVFIILYFPDLISGTGCDTFVFQNREPVSDRNSDGPKPGVRPVAGDCPGQPEGQDHQ